MVAVAIPAGWADLPFWQRGWSDVQAALAADPRPRGPADESIFAALAATPPEQVKVLILGQDPYPTLGDATGLSFSVPATTKLPKSLENIYREMKADLGARPADGDLGHWADQGVLLLNAALTVPLGVKNGHQKIGWAALVDDILRRLDDRPRALVLWGAFAQKRGALMHNPGHLRIETAHPSPLSAYRGFFGSRPFSRINDWLGPDQTINWIRQT